MCGLAKVLMMTVEHKRQTWKYCTRCWYETNRPWNTGPIDQPKKRPKGTEPGELAGKSLVTGDRYHYTDQEIDLRTGERTKRT
jgi:hypothetical protein